MALVGIALGPKAGVNAGVMRSVPVQSEAKTSFASSTQSGFAAAGSLDLYWEITTDTNIWAKFGSNPTAAAGDDYLILAGQTRHFLCGGDGEKVAIIVA